MLKSDSMVRVPLSAAQPLMTQSTVQPPSALRLIGKSAELHAKPCGREKTPDGLCVSGRHKCLCLRRTIVFGDHGTGRDLSGQLFFSCHWWRLASPVAGDIGGGTEAMDDSARILLGFCADSAQESGLRVRRRLEVRRTVLVRGSGGSSQHTSVECFSRLANAVHDSDGATCKWRLGLLPVGQRLNQARLPSPNQGRRPTRPDCQRASEGSYHEADRVRSITE
ncbi:hypothetical protein BJ875DRAFT_140423 [Amylocarpus encephaloides]|uniref:Uncharacterized protein n=1 Tax=Amylocarpus encephaloides TaxID=45428 RepID=A0A9P7YBP4_9HELO|nr:hypothetical protein BJ875DRAFT_140423 [Amylocarpus encephaloides]